MTPTQPGVAPDQIEVALKALVRSHVRPDTDPEKSRQYSDLRKLEWYWLGEQFLSRASSGGNAADWRPINGNWSANQNTNDARLYAYYTNEIRGYGRKFIAVCSQQEPKIKGAPNKEDNEDHVILARKADLVARSLYELWSIGRQTPYIFLTFWKAGPAFSRVRWVANRKKYGETEIPIMGMDQQPDGPGVMRCIQCGTETPVEGEMPPAACPMCSTPFVPEDYQPPQMVDVPVEQGTVKYANGCAEMEILNSMFVTTPFDIRNIKETPWLEYAREPHASSILESYRGKAEADESKRPVYEKLRARLTKSAESGDSQMPDSSDGRYTRAIATSYNGQEYGTRRHRCLFQEIYVRSGMLEMVGEDATREALIGEFPDGLKITFIDGEYVEHEAANIDDEWDVEAPEIAETIYADPLAKDLLSMQDFNNAMLNISAETKERAIPQTLVNVEMVSWREQQNNRLPASMIPVRPKQGMKISDSVQQMPQARSDPESDAYAAAWREHAVQNVGITPSIYGGGEKENTAYAANLKRNQALVQLSMSIKAARRLIARSLELGVKCMAKYSNGRVPSPWAPATEADQIDLSELLEGGWHMAAEDSMPISPGEQRAALMELIEKAGQNPAFFDLFNFPAPDNIDEVTNIVGIPEWKVKNQDSHRKFRSTLRRLLQGEPIESQPMIGPMGEMIPGQLMPSIPADEFEDDHGFMANATQLWAQGEEAELARAQKPGGYANVIAWGKAHAMMMPPPMPAEGGPTAGGPAPGSERPPDAPPQNPPNPQG